jgi:hypothetical protein
MRGGGTPEGGSMKFCTLKCIWLLLHCLALPRWQVMLICRGPSIRARLVLPNADFRRDNCAPFASHIEGLKDEKGFSTIFFRSYLWSYRISR